MKVLCVTHFFAAHGGGIEKVADRICRGLVARGVSVTWAATERPGESPPPQPGLVAEPLAGWSGMETRFGLPFPIPSRRSRARLAALAADSDLVHMHDGIYPAGHIAASSGREHGKPVVLTQHIGDIPFANLFQRAAVRVANRLLTRRLLRRADAVVFVSRAVQGFFADVVPPRRSVLVFNGVDLDVFSPAASDRDERRRILGFDPGRPVFLFVGRFVTKKGLARVRDAASSLTGIQWVLAGRGPEDPRTWGLPNVRTVGFVQARALADLYRAADLLVLPSVGEGFPLVVQEAMACGTPCLVSEETRQACPPVAPLILSAGSGGRDFVQACRRALENGGLDLLRGRVSAAARAEWSWERCVGQYFDLFSRIAAGHGQVDAIAGAES